jgi:hypothetical protein
MMSGSAQQCTVLGAWKPTTYYQPSRLDVDLLSQEPGAARQPGDAIVVGADGRSLQKVRLTLPVGTFQHVCTLAP